MYIIIKPLFEEHLLRTWANFIDHKKLIVKVLQIVQDTEFPITKTKEIKQKSVGIKLSRFEPQTTNFSLWVEFSIPQEESMIIGTSEFTMSPLGELNHIQTIGNKFIKT